MVDVSGRRQVLSEAARLRKNKQRRLARYRAALALPPTPRKRFRRDKGLGRPHDAEIRFRAGLVGLAKRIKGVTYPQIGPYLSIEELRELLP